MTSGSLSVLGLRLSPGLQKCKAGVAGEEGKKGKEGEERGGQTETRSPMPGTAGAHHARAWA